MGRFEGKVALVTGGTRGIGRACAAALAKEGANVAICGRNEPAARTAAEELKAETGGHVLGYGCDIADGGAVDAMVSSVTDTLGPISVLVNNAAVTRDGLLMRMKDDDWHSVLQTDLTGPFYCTRAVIRGMVKQRYGRIVTISSIVGLRGQAGQSNYAAAKAGLVGFTKAVAQELASRNITANVVAPGYVKTDMTAALSGDIEKKFLERIPAARPGSPEDVAAAVLFLASEEAGYITGHVLNVDGGLGM